MGPGRISPTSAPYVSAPTSVVATPRDLAMLSIVANVVALHLTVLHVYLHYGRIFRTRPSTPARLASCHGRHVLVP